MFTTLTRQMTSPRPTAIDPATVWADFNRGFSLDVVMRQASREIRNNADIGQRNGKTARTETRMTVRMQNHFIMGFAVKRVSEELMYDEKTGSGSDV